ncbi:MAG: 23S rRNA (pseudouridine(1915)-N(3))-methyltransferase RlmH [Clostridiales bacterium]|nr:23S rRNA (pseudouridine(1915)-N(3))-methyltransferase RlmH [Clostridia bacterium]MCR5353648.1 23S rRNA (pseudouridine(1915)-N(3))-methyltransferase RlmH [Clostridiales bacterium]
MLNVTLIYLGAKEEAFFRDAKDEYAKRLKKYCVFREKCLKPEFLPSNPSENEIFAALAKEKAKILDAVPKGAYTVAMCVEGTELSSEKFAGIFENCANNGFSDVAFIIGSSFGLDESLKNECRARVSMSKMTFAHSLAAVMLHEQIYRAFCILKGEKYHK